MLLAHLKSGYKLARGAAAGDATLALIQGQDMNFYAYTTRDVAAGEELTLAYPLPAARPDHALFHYGFLPGGVQAELSAEPKLAALDLPGGSLHDMPTFSEEDYRALLRLGRQGRGMGVAARPSPVHRLVPRAQAELRARVRADAAVRPARHSPGACDFVHGCRAGLLSYTPGTTVTVMLYCLACAWQGVQVEETQPQQWSASKPGACSLR